MTISSTTSSPLGARPTPRRHALSKAYKVIGMCIVPLVAVYLLCIGYLWFNAPVISFDAIARLHAMLPKVSDDERAWPMYKKGVLAIADPDTVPGHMPKFENAILADDPTPDDAHRSKVRAWLLAHREGIDTIIAASSKPALGYVPIFGWHSEDADLFPSTTKVDTIDSATVADALFGIPTHQLPTLRTISKCLSTDSLFAVEDGDGARFVRNIKAMIALSHHAEEDHLLVSQLVGTSIRFQAFKRIVWALEWRPDALTDAQLRELASILRTIPQTAYQADLGGELLMLEDILQRTYSDDGEGNGWFNGENWLEDIRFIESMSGGRSNGSVRKNLSMSTMAVAVLMSPSRWSWSRPLVAPVCAATIASRGETLSVYKALCETAESQSRLPMWEQGDAFESAFEAKVNQEGLDQLKWMYPRTLLCPINDLIANRRLGESYSWQAQLAIALTQSRRAHAGEWPTTLDELVPKYLNEVPRNPSTGKPVTFEVRDGKPIVKEWGFMR